MVKPLLLNSASAYASSVINKFLNSFTICGFRLQILRIALTFSDSNYILRNPQQIKCADKIYVTSICTRNTRKCCTWNPLTFWNMFNYLSLESRNKQTQNYGGLKIAILANLGQSTRDIFRDV